MAKITRAQFLRRAALAGGVLIGGSLLADDVLASSPHGKKDFTKFYGVLFDATKCIGCRTCERACNLVNNRPQPDKLRVPEPPFDNTTTVFDKRRRTGYSSHTVINRFYPKGKDADPTYMKYQCMHCNQPACVSACIVGALRKHEEGPVHYSQAACIGCRYCLTVCPFQVPVYEYFDPFSPAMLKCTLCEPRLQKGMLPGCVKACPMQTMTFGHRDELSKLAHALIDKYPDRYHPEVWGENVVGGTGWTYLLPKGITDSEVLGMPLFNGLTDPIPPITEEIQHTIFKYFIPPAVLYGVLAGVHFYYEKNPRPVPGEMTEGGEAHE